MSSFGEINSSIRTHEKFPEITIVTAFNLQSKIKKLIEDRLGRSNTFEASSAVEMPPGIQKMTYTYEGSGSIEESGQKFWYKFQSVPGIHGEQLVNCAVIPRSYVHGFSISDFLSQKVLLLQAYLGDVLTEGTISAHQKRHNRF